MARPRPLKNEDVLRIISIAPGPGGKVFPSRHFREQALERNFDIQDAIKVLAEASRVKAVWNTKSSTWNYDIPGRDIEGRKLTVRIAVTEVDDEIVLVTAF